MKIQTYNGLKGEIDPCGEYKGHSRRDIIESCGLIPSFADSVQDGESLRDAVIRAYPYYMGPMEGGTVTPEGYYTYPGDPPLAPFLTLTHNSERLYIYPYGIVAVVPPSGPTWATRMD